MHDTMNMHPYSTYRQYLCSRFGSPVLRVPIDAGFSCPNRDGTISTQGCSFCDTTSYSPAAGSSLSPLDQLTIAIQRTPRTHLFIPYLQPFSNTYGPVERLRGIYEPLIAHPGVVGLAVGTRPDCLPPDVCSYLADVARRTYLCVEIGLQSSSDAVLDAINRGHSAASFVDAVWRLSRLGIHVAAHVIIGLPGDTEQTTARTAALVAALPVHGVKIHQLMIVKNTPLAEQYTRAPFPLLSLMDYTTRVAGFIACLRPDQYIYRIAAGVMDRALLVAPEWGASKAAIQQAVHTYCIRNNIVQGCAQKKGECDTCATLPEERMS